MLQLKPETPGLWDSILPEELRKLPEELARVDALLRDERLLEPFLRRFNQPRTVRACRSRPACGSCT